MELIDKTPCLLCERGREGISGDALSVPIMHLPFFRQLCLQWVGKIPMTFSLLKYIEFIII